MSPATDTDDVLAVRGLRRDFGGVHAVVDTSFVVPTAKITGLIGPNGAGKSTVLGMIAGAIRHGRRRGCKGFVIESRRQLPGEFVEGAVFDRRQYRRFRLADGAKRQNIPGRFHGGFQIGWL